MTTRTTYYQQLPTRLSGSRVRVKLNDGFRIHCKCGYRGYTKAIRGMSKFPIYVCPQCHSMVQK